LVRTMGVEPIPPFEERILSSIFGLSRHIIPHHQFRLAPTQSAGIIITQHYSPQPDVIGRLGTG
jgi:hypothetical protein